MMPSLTSGWPNLALSDAMRIAHAIAISHRRLHGGESDR
jgi:hypothetical protein